MINNSTVHKKSREKINSNDSFITTLSSLKKNSSSILSTMKNNSLKVSGLVDKSITLTCSIDLDDVNFSKSGNYKVNHWKKKSFHFLQHKF